MKSEYLPLIMVRYNMPSAPDGRLITFHPTGGQAAKIPLEFFAAVKECLGSEWKVTLESDQIGIACCPHGMSREESLEPFKWAIVAAATVLKRECNVNVVYA